MANYILFIIELSENTAHIFLKNQKQPVFGLKKHDVLFAGSGETITEIGKSAAFIDDIEAYAGGDILIFRPFDMDGTYLGYLMNSQLVRQQLNKYGTGATVMHIYNSDLAKVKVPNISREKQDVIGVKLELLSRSLFDVYQILIAPKPSKNPLSTKSFRYGKNR
jgi:type I restriction enzyme, S subunit